MDVIKEVQRCISGILVRVASVLSLRPMNDEVFQMVNFEAMMVPDAEATILSIPTDVILRLKALPWEGVGIISGNATTKLKNIKLKRLDIVQGANFKFIIEDESVKEIFIAAEELFIHCPQDVSQIAHIGFELAFGLDGVNPSKAGDGVNYGADNTGRHGGDGQHGITGEHGRTFNGPTLYVFFQNIQIINEIPGTATLVNLAFGGIRGGNGSQGGEGGNGGNGANGTPARDNEVAGVPVSCGAGPGQGGNSGVPGSGGKGGDAGTGGSASNIYIVGPRSERRNIRFAAELNGGSAGSVGEPGVPGAIGYGGAGGNLTNKCRDGRPVGARRGPNPIDFGRGQPGVDGNNGNFEVNYRDNSDIFTVV